VNNLAIRASNFINSIGINTHLNYTDGAYANTANVEADLAYLGITTVRDAVPNPAGGIPYYNQTTAIETLAATGIKFDFVSQPGTVSIATTVQELEAFNAAFPGSGNLCRADRPSRRRRLPGRARHRHQGHALSLRRRRL
jgi:hypothetical protein